MLNSDEEDVSDNEINCFMTNENDNEFAIENDDFSPASSTMDSMMTDFLQATISKQEKEINLLRRRLIRMREEKDEWKRKYENLRHECFMQDFKKQGKNRYDNNYE